MSESVNTNTMFSERTSNNNFATLVASEESSLSQRPLNYDGGATQMARHTSTATLTITQPLINEINQEDILPLTLRARPSVTWEESTIDNEGLGRKTSKRCCIFHKQRDFGESSSDSSGEESDGGSSSGSSSSGGPSKNRKKPIARPKQKIANYQRYHA